MKIRQLILQLREIEEISSVCNRCGMCQAVCPVFGETGRESDVARGKIALIDGLRASVLTEPVKVLERLNQCLLCGSCEAGCSRKVDVLELFIRARVIIAGYSRMPLIKKIVLRTIVSHPVVFNRAVRFASRWQHLLIKPAGGATKTATVRKGVPLLKNRAIVPLAKESFRDKLNKKPPPKADGRNGETVLFFTGCLIDRVLPEIGISCVDVLAHHGVAVHVPEQEGCCGIPAITSGDLASFNSLVEYNLKMFSELEYDTIVTACATCTFTLKKVWPMLYEHSQSDVADTVTKISESTVDILDYLAGFARRDGNDSEADTVHGDNVITWHDPCHLKKTSGIAGAPRRLLNSLEGITFREMAEADRCCGSGGSFTLDHYDISTGIGSRKCQNIMDSGASVVATGCPACMLQLTDMLAKTGTDIQVKHLVEILDQMIKRKQ